MSIDRVVVVGASSGGIEALRTLVASLPEEFPAPICVVVHTGSGSPRVVAGILGRAGRLAAESARDGQALRPGTIFVAPPDVHMLLEPGIIRLTRGPKENRFRPAVDPLFRSAAQVYGPAAIGVILSGNLHDGTDGLWAIRQLGGTAIVQDPAEALFPSMPASAREHVRVDHVVGIRELGPLLVMLTSRDTSTRDRDPRPLPALDVEVAIAKETNAMDAGLSRVSAPSGFACPECHGVLLQLNQEGPIRFRCHTGHAYSAEGLLASLQEDMECSIWRAIRALDEGARLWTMMAGQIQDAHPARANHAVRRASVAHEGSEMLRTWIRSRECLGAPLSAPDDPDP